MGLVVPCNRQNVIGAPESGLMEKLMGNQIDEDNEVVNQKHKTMADMRRQGSFCITVIVVLLNTLGLMAKQLCSSRLKNREC